MKGLIQQMNLYENKIYTDMLGISPTNQTLNEYCTPIMTTDQSRINMVKGVEDEDEDVERKKKGRWSYYQRLYQ